MGETVFNGLILKAVLMASCLGGHIFPEEKNDTVSSFKTKLTFVVISEELLAVF